MSTKGGFMFTREQAAVLIAMYESHPILYHVQNEMYRNKTRRTLDLESIANDFNTQFPMANVTTEDCKKKINSLRTQFFAELNKVKKSMVSGMSSEDVYKPTLWCFDQLLFLNDSNVITAGESNLVYTENNEYAQFEPELLYDGSVDEFNENDLVNKNLMSPTTSRPSTRTSSYSEEHIGQQTQRPVKKRKAVSNLDSKGSTIQLIEQATNLLQETRNPPEVSASDAFGMMVSAELKNMKNPARCRRVKRKILDILHQALDEEDE